MTAVIPDSATPVDMPVETRRKVTDLFTRDEIAMLTERSDLMGFYAVGFTWAVIGLTFAALAWASAQPLAVAVPVFALGFVVLAGRHLGLAILHHEAAHKTLDLVDHSKQQTDLIKKALSRVSAARVRVFASNNAPSDVQNLLDAVGALEVSVNTGTGHLRANLTDLAQIQEYQDLTGQIIKRVIRVVRDVEAGLIVLLRSTGSALKAGHAALPEEKLEGPAVPGLSVSSSQQDADALLAELGF